MDICDNCQNPTSGPERVWDMCPLCLSDLLAAMSLEELQDVPAAVLEFASRASTGSV
jgi:hypothetical protein